MISKFFGESFHDKNERIRSYELLQQFITDIGKYYPGKTEEHVGDLRHIIGQYDNPKFSFLVCHTGYIPEEYSHDSSEETLYSKLVELIVQEWALRIGFDQSCLPSQKSSMEDITIQDSTCIIVSDAKSFRLGRSQPAPNVKDVLKHADISKWLSAHSGREHLGGLVAFPRQLDWKGGSDFYQYTTDKSLPTMCLHYEHMSFLCLLEDAKNRICSAFRQYADIFPAKRLKSERNRDYYYEIIEKNLFNGVLNEWEDFKKTAYLVSNERVYHTYHNLILSIQNTKKNIADGINAIDDISLLRSKLIHSESQRLTHNLDKQVKRIRDFRDMTDGYYE